jgi:hypothetical protein
MPGGGQIGIVAVGNQNRYFNGNPEFTYFYKVYKRFTHFSQESITVTLDGPSVMDLDYSIQLRAKIPRQADLLTSLTFVFDIPDIYSNIYIDLSNNMGSQFRPASFRWAHMLGTTIIDNVSIFVGGSQVQSFTGEWLAIRAAADMPIDKYLIWRNMVGDTPELNNPEWGILGKSPNYPFAKGEYPHNVIDANAPAGTGGGVSINGREIRVPLPFWFSESWGAALPLVALQLHEVEVRIQLKTLRDIYRIMDDVFQSEPVRYGRKLLYNPALPVSTSTTDASGNLLIAPPPFDNLTLQAQYQTYTDPNGLPRFYYTDLNSRSVPKQDGFTMNAHLEGNYIYITEKEQAIFAERELTHVVHQVQRFSFPSITARAVLDLDVHGILNRMIFFGRRSDAIESRNDFINLSNWKNLNQAPYWPTSNAAFCPNSGRLLSYAQRDILRSARLLLAGNEMFEEKPANYFELHTQYQNAAGSGAAGINPGGLKPDDVMGPLYHINFALNVSDHSQPSGTLNTSRIREVQLEVQPWDLDPLSPFAYDFTVYCETVNIVKFTNGMGGLGFAI